VRAVLHDGDGRFVRASASGMFFRPDEREKHIACQKFGHRDSALPANRGQEWCQLSLPSDTCPEVDTTTGWRSGADKRLCIDVATVPDGGKILGLVEGEDVLLVRHGTEFFAVGANCTHYHEPLADD
jgi:hypothetical protein